MKIIKEIINFPLCTLPSFRFLLCIFFIFNSVELYPAINATDLQTRNQFPQNEDNDVSIVASPEVYNHLNLRVNYHNISHYYMDSMATGEDPPACHGLSSTDHSQPKGKRISWNLLRNDDNGNPDMLDKCSKKKGLGDRFHDHTKNEQLDIYSTPNKGVKMKQPNAFSKQRQQKNCCKTVKFKTTDTCQAAAVRKTDSQPNQTEESSISTHDGDLYANNNSLAYDNKCFRPESPMNQEDSDDYFDVSYDGYLAMSSSQNNTPGHTKSASSETDPDLSDYVNADGLDSYR